MTNGERMYRMLKVRDIVGVSLFPYSLLCGSGSGFGIRIRDPDSGSGSVFGIRIRIHQSLNTDPIWIEIPNTGF